MTRFLVCLLLLGTCNAVAAHDVRHQAAGGDGGTSTDCAPDPGAGVPASAAAPTARPASPAHKPVTLRGGDNTLLRAPRWHSFLPGMIR